MEIREISTEMRSAYLDYAMSVIVGRALPDVRDGLKPVHRRTLFSMFEGGMRAGTSRRKCAVAVGDDIDDEDCQRRQRQQQHAERGGREGAVEDVAPLGPEVDRTEGRGGAHHQAYSSR